MQIPLLKISGLTFAFAKGAEPLLHNIDLECYAGRIYGLFGNNGSGKTTLFNLISGFLKYQKGEICYYGDIPKSHEPSTICSFRGGLTRTFQIPVLVQELSVFENLLLAFRTPEERFSTLIKVRSASSQLYQKNIKKIEQYLNEFGLGEIRAAPAGTLSYGQRRIVSNILALLNDSRIILLDEPFANLAYKQVELFKAALRREARESGRCILVVEHSAQNLIDNLIDSLFYLRGSLRTYSFNGDTREMTRTLHSLMYSHG